ncbi:hypothetical protein TGDOM2_204315 [Toxoplasma gondii GAB2-2007-GAL-DOM2]|uniref:Uncharacterized protein n=3 Tax=Toxoplasma gondii TaxID=5811 RepID=V4ZH25_TOXGV|nr:hypothetical protein TGVEG_204315 [Toxoplasma gondii VEG]KFG38112.1 hypothetical protein TGDOM2_204315 [Toxoplasma gondii GAB2-2007-GAL-DOM2]KFG46418.1 hypothetical protein TGP89_204315 [Toxoplasma gondii p89]
MPPATTSEMVFRYLTRGWVFSAASKDPAIFERRGKRIGSVTEQSYECYRRRKRRRLSRFDKRPSRAPSLFFLDLLYPSASCPSTRCPPCVRCQEHWIVTSRSRGKQDFLHIQGVQTPCRFPRYVWQNIIALAFLRFEIRADPSRSEEFRVAFLARPAAVVCGFSSAFFSVSRPSPVLLITMCKCMGEFSGVSSPLDL